MYSQECSYLVTTFGTYFLQCVQGSLGIYAGLEARTTFKNPFDIMERLIQKCELFFDALSLINDLTAPLQVCFAKEVLNDENAEEQAEERSKFLNQVCSTLARDLTELGIFNNPCDIMTIVKDMTSGWMTFVGFELDVSLIAGACPGALTECTSPRSSMLDNIVDAVTSNVGSCLSSFGLDAVADLFGAISGSNEECTGVPDPPPQVSGTVKHAFLLMLV